MKSDNLPLAARTGSGEVQRAILARISTGEYRIGARLPSCDDLATELRVNKNTVNKAYQALRRAGYLDSSPGRGTFVRRRALGAGVDRAELENLAALLVQEAKLAGLDRAALTELVEGIAARYFGRRGVRVGFVECTHEEAATLSRDLQVQAGHPIAPVLLAAAVADPDAVIGRFDLLGVPVAHQHELEDAIDRLASTPRPEMIGLVVSPDAESLASIVRLRAGTRVAIVCDLEETIRTLSGIIGAYNPHLRLAGVTTGDQAALSAALAAADVVVATLSAGTHLLENELPPPTVTVRFRLEPSSVAEVAARIDEIAVNAPELRVVR